HRDIGNADLAAVLQAVAVAVQPDEIAERGELRRCRQRRCQQDCQAKPFKGTHCSHRCCYLKVVPATSKDTLASLRWFLRAPQECFRDEVAPPDAGRSRCWRRRPQRRIPTRQSYMAQLPETQRCFLDACGGPLVSGA